MALKKGDKAPAFALARKPGEVVDVGQHIGKETVVLLFFPFAFSSVCTKEMCHFRDTWKQWEELDAKVFGISVDSPFVVDKFRQDENIPFPILSDFNKDVARKYGVLFEEFKGMKGVAKRAAFVIDPSGRISYAAVNEDPSVQVDFDAISDAVSAAQPV